MFFKLIMMKLNFKKINYDVIVITSPKNITKLTSQDFFHLDCLGPSQSKFLATPVSYYQQSMNVTSIAPFLAGKDLFPISK